jgi:hypothetical protein
MIYLSIYFAFGVLVALRHKAAPESGGRLKRNYL